MKLFSSDRLDYYPLADSHFNEFLAMELDPVVMKFYTSRPTGTKEAAQASFNKYKAYMANFPKLGGFAVFKKDTTEFIGLGVLAHIEMNTSIDQYEVGYRLPQKSWGQGYATEICKRLIQYGLEDLQMSEIFGTTHPQHVASQKVLEKCGLVRIGTSANYGGSALFKIEKKK